MLLYAYLFCGKPFNIEHYDSKDIASASQNNGIQREFNTISYCTCILISILANSPLILPHFMLIFTADCSTFSWQTGKWTMGYREVWCLRSNELRPTDLLNVTGELI